MSKKFLIPIIIVGVTSAVLFTFRKNPGGFNDKISGIKKSADVAIQDIKKEITNPPPLRALYQSPKSFLTREGVVKWTNIQRANNKGLPALSGNQILNVVATRKLQDMFNRQYFEHISPDNKSVGDLVEAAGYEYIAVGENLALGNYENDQVLVQAWMDSPGHRANILNSKFKEIGVAVGKGMFEGKETWLAVQTFALPLTACPQADAALKAQIEWLELQVDDLKRKAEAFLAEMENDKRNGNKDAYNAKVEEYNAVVKQINDLVLQIKMLIVNYNTQVQAFNTCIANQ